MIAGDVVLEVVLGSAVMPDAAAASMSRWSPAHHRASHVSGCIGLGPADPKSDKVYLRPHVHWTGTVIIELTDQSFAAGSVT